MISTKLFLALAGLLSLVSSHPTSPSNSLDARTPYQECQPYTYWYVCANGYRGCFAQDPCSLPPIPTMADPALPAPPVVTPTTPPTPVQTGQIFRPTVYNTQPEVSGGFHSTDQVPHVDLQPVIRQNVLVFSGIPAGAKQCSLSWRVDQSNFPGQFDCQGDCLVSVRELSGFPKGVPINPETIKAFITENFDGGSMDFTFWDSGRGLAQGQGTWVSCKETVVVELALNVNTGKKDSRLLLDLDDKNGIYLTWKM